MRRTFIRMEAEKSDSWRPSCVVQSARPIPVIGNSCEPHEYFVKPSTGTIEPHSMAGGERFMIGHTSSVHFAELSPDSRQPLS